MNASERIHPYARSFSSHRRCSPRRAPARSRQALRRGSPFSHLVTFGLTLHLPAHFIIGQPGFQFEINQPWIDNARPSSTTSASMASASGSSSSPACSPPSACSQAGTSINERRKIFYSLFLVQQTAMFGVFVSLDLMVYYGFWELSLVPMAILIAMYGRKDGPKAAVKFFLFTFIPSAPLLVAILWLYARTGTFNFSELQHRRSPTELSQPTHSSGSALAFLFAFAVKVPIFPLHGWLADSFSEAPVALAMVVAGKLGLYSMLRFHVGLFPAQARAIAPLLIALAVIGILYGACLALVQRDFWRLIAFATLSHFSLTTLGIYGLTLTGRDGAIYQTLNEGVIEGALFVLLGVLDTRYRYQPDRQLRRSRRKASAHRDLLCHHRPRHDRPPHAQWLRRRVPHPLEHLHRRQPRLGHRRHPQRHPQRRLHALAGAAALLRAREPDDRGHARLTISRFSEMCRAGSSRCSDAGDGS